MKFKDPQKSASTTFRRTKIYSVLTVLGIISGIVSAVTAKAVAINVQVPGAQAVSASANPGGIVANFYSFALLISGILAFGAIVWGGIKYALAAGNPSGQSEGKEWIMGALWGILLLAGAYLLLHTINPALINLNIQPLSPLTQPSTQSGGGGGSVNNNAGNKTILQQ